MASNLALSGKFWSFVFAAKCFLSLQTRAQSAFATDRKSQKFRRANEQGFLVLWVAIVPVLALMTFAIALVLQIQRHQREYKHICREESLKAQQNMAIDLQTISEMNTISRTLSGFQFAAQFVRFLPADEAAYQLILRSRYVLGLTQKAFVNLRIARVLKTYTDTRKRMMERNSLLGKFFDDFFQIELKVLPPSPTAYALRAEDFPLPLYEGQRYSRIYSPEKDFSSKQEMTITWLQKLKPGRLRGSESTPRDAPTRNEILSSPIPIIQSGKGYGLPKQCASTLELIQNKWEPRLTKGKWLLNW